MIGINPYDLITGKKFDDEIVKLLMENRVDPEGPIPKDAGVKLMIALTAFTLKKTAQMIEANNEKLEQDLKQLGVIK